MPSGIVSQPARRKTLIRKEKCFHQGNFMKKKTLNAQRSTLNVQLQGSDASELFVKALGVERWALNVFSFSSPITLCVTSLADYLRLMIELEVYAAGVRDLNKILELDHQLEAVPGLRYKVDSNHDIVYLELDEPTITFRELR